MTVEPAPTIAQRPISTGAMQTARAPTEAPVRRVTPTAVQSSVVFSRPSGVTALGKESFVNTTAGPTKTPSSRTAGS